MNVQSRLLTLLAASLLSGCVTLDSLVRKELTASPNVCQVVPIWDPRVTLTPDPARGGAPAPGLVGRLYLFGPTVDFPLVGDGSVVVFLYNETPAAEGKGRVLLEQWNFDADTLKRLVKRDMIGLGYTLFLPWGTHHPSITHVQMQMKYEPRQGAPLFAPPIALTLEHPPEGSQPVKANEKLKQAKAGATARNAAGERH
jgi:hypothetical protein